MNRHASPPPQHLPGELADYLEGLMEGFVVYDAGWRMTYMNAAAEKLVGRKREEVLGKTWREAFPHAVGNPVDLMYQRVMRERAAQRMELYYEHYGRWFELGASPVRAGGIAETARPHLGHELTVSLPAEPIELYADRVRLTEVFANLLNNAGKYTAKGGSISLVAAREGADVVVTVRDTGIGISPEHLPRLFEMFSQVAPALERSQSGLGIGLALSRGLVEIVRLPVIAESAVPQPERRAGKRSRPVSGRRILVVDDNADAAGARRKTCANPKRPASTPTW